MRSKIMVSSIILLFLILNDNNLAQQTSLKIIYVKGNVEVGNDLNWRSAIVSQKLKENDNIRISDGEILLLSDERKNNSLELKTKGIYKVSALLNKFANNDPGIFSKIIKFLEEEIFSSKSSDTFIPGAIKRSTNSIRVAIPESSKVLDDNINIRWYGLGEDFEYCLRITDRFGKKVFENSTKDTIYNFDYKKYSLLQDEYYFWQISSCKNPQLKSDESYFYILNDKMKQEIKDSVALINKAFNEDDNNSIFNKFILAKYFMTQNLNFDALENFEELSKSPFFIDEFRNSYIRFLVRVSLVDKADSLQKNN